MEAYLLDWANLLLRWLHVATSIVWLGLIWFVNFIQLAAVRDADETERAALHRLIVPQVAKTFRYSSHLVMASGVLLLITSGYLLDRLMFTSAVYIPPLRNWLLWGGTFAGTAMWALVHFRISPALKIVLSDAPAEAKAAADEAARRLQAAQRAEQLSADLQLAAQDDQAAVKRASAASDELSALLRRQLSGYAGDLAQGLVAGELCPVCGSLDHPKLAELAADHVDQSDIDRAQAAVELTYAQAKKAAARSQQLEERRQSEFLAAGQQSVPEAEAVASQARQVMAEAAAAGDELRRSRNRLTKLQEQTDAITASLDQAQELALIHI